MPFHLLQYLAMALGNVRINCGEVWMCGSGDMHE